MIVGDFVQEVERAFIVVTLFSLKIMNVENVIKKYVISVSSVRGGLNWIIRIIQPRWAMEE